MQIDFDYADNQENALNVGLAFEKDLKNVYEIALKETGVNENVLVNIVFVCPDKIKEMNKKYRNVDAVTDVLSFPMLDDINNIESELDYVCGSVAIGDIYINLERAKEQAIEYGHSLRREFCFLALHGLLHLLGYDHMQKDEEQEMCCLQDAIMEKANIGRD